MRIVYTSDLHIDASEANREAARRLADAMKEKNADVLVVAGDAGNTLASLTDALSDFSDFKGTKLFVAGNHDVWVEKLGGEDVDSREKFARRIPQICRDHGFSDLSHETVVVEGCGFVGSLGWYDYSLADPRLRLSEDDYWVGIYDGEKWWDKQMTFWPQKDGGGVRMRDPEVCAELTGDLERRIRSIEDGVESIVAVVHTLAYEVTLQRSNPPYFLDAFTGSTHIGAVLSSHPKVIHCIGGHKHVSGDWIVGGVQSHRRVLGRADTGSDLSRRVLRAFGTIEI